MTYDTVDRETVDVCTEDGVRPTHVALPDPYYRSGYTRRATARGCSATRRCVPTGRRACCRP
jgi:hypothetical protein